MILDSQRPSGGQMTSSSHCHPWPQNLYALARHATWSGNGTLIHTVQLIRHQQVRGSSPRVGSSICKRLRTNDTPSQTNVSPQNSPITTDPGD